MTILAWVVLGLLAGFIGSKIVNKTGENLLLDILLGIAGAVAAGSSISSAMGVTGLNLYRLLVAVVVAAMVLAVWHAIRGIDRLALGSKKKGGGELPATFSLVRHRETQSPEI